MNGQSWALGEEEEKEKEEGRGGGGGGPRAAAFTGVATHQTNAARNSAPPSSVLLVCLFVCLFVTNDSHFRAHNSDYFDPLISRSPQTPRDKGLLRDVIIVVR